MTKEILYTAMFFMMLFFAWVGFANAQDSMNIYVDGKKHTIVCAKGAQCPKSVRIKNQFEACDLDERQCVFGDGGCDGEMEFYCPGQKYNVCAETMQEAEREAYDCLISR